MIIAIIGAGASGMAAALAASDTKENKIYLLEKQARVGKKLAATGNGRCNLTNLQPLDGRYHGEDPAFVNFALEKFPPNETLDWFRSLGLFTMNENNGKVYPYSEQANSVVDTLRFALNKPNISLRTDFEILKIRKSGQKYILESKDEQLICDRLIIACGGLAGTKLGGSLSGYKLLQSLGHKATRLRPSLVQIKTDWDNIKSLKGVRANCKVSILHNEVKKATSEGELQFTDYGLSGPVIFEISRDACSKKGCWEAHLDFLPQMSESALLNELIRRKSTDLITDDFMIGILHNRLGKVLVKEAKIPFGVKICEISNDKIKKLCKLTKELSVVLKEPMGMDQAQVTAGGISTDEFDSKTLESRISPGLYACGEILDIDGDCGGFNLQWAWSPGRLAGICASKKS